MSASCAACQAEAVDRAQLQDRVGEDVWIAFCRECGAATPQYPVTFRGVSEQVAFHDTLWGADGVASYREMASDFDRTIEFFMPFTGPPEAGKTILEVGCGRGGLLKALLARGYDALGCEPSSLLSERARTALDLSERELATEDWRCFLNRVGASGSKAHAVFLWHVLEHVAEPVSLVRAIKSVLSPRGHLIMQLPRLSRDNIFPAHLFLLEPLHFGRFGALAGMEVVHVSHSWTEQFASVVFRPSVAVKAANSLGPNGLVETLAAALSDAGRSVMETRAFAAREHQTAAAALLAQAGLKEKIATLRSELEFRQIAFEKMRRELLESEDERVAMALTAGALEQNASEIIVQAAMLSCELDDALARCEGLDSRLQEALSVVVDSELSCLRLERECARLVDEMAAGLERGKELDRAASMRWEALQIQELALARESALNRRLFDEIACADDRIRAAIGLAQGRADEIGKRDAQIADLKKELTAFSTRIAQSEALVADLRRQHSGDIEILNAAFDNARSRADELRNVGLVRLLTALRLI